MEALDSFFVGFMLGAVLTGLGIVVTVGLLR